jgi:hypothetical protein
MTDRIWSPRSEDGAGETSRSVCETGAARPRLTLLSLVMMFHVASTSDRALAAAFDLP